MADHTSSFPQYKPVARPGSVVSGADYRITILTPALIRFEHSPDGGFEDRPSTFVVQRDLPSPEIKVKKGEDKLEIMTDTLYIQYWYGDFTENSLLVGFRKDVGFWPGDWRWGQAPGGNLGGTARTLDEVNGNNVELEPGVVSEGGFAFIDDSASFLFDSDGWIGQRKPRRKDGYLFAHGRDYRAALKDYFSISGKPPVPPRYALGNWYTRFYPYTTDEYLQLIDKFTTEGIPLSIAVLDIAWHLMESVPKDAGSPWTGFTWEKTLYPDPPAFLKALHDKGLVVSLNNHPHDGIRYFEDTYKQVCEHMGRDPKEKLPVWFDCCDRKFMDAYFNIVCKARQDEGCDFWWIDWQQGRNAVIPGVDPLWVLNHYHFMDHAKDGKRGFTLSRYAGPGSHRYPLGFSGDTHITWESLNYQPEFTATASNIGYGWWSHDIGGHLKGYHDDELTARWVQLGCWSPILRLHCSNNPFCTREPWRHNTECRQIMGETLRMRKRLIPYLYSMAVLNSKHGTTLVEPMYYNHPFEDSAYRHKNQFWFGTELIVSPVTSRRDKETQMGKAMTWLPEGTWIDIFTGMVYRGDVTHTMHRPLEQLPVLGKAGGIIPFDNFAETKHGHELPESIELVVVVGKDGEFVMYEDDERDNDVDRIKFAKTPIEYTQSTGTIEIGPTSNPLMKERRWSIRLPGVTKVDVAVQVGGRTVKAKVDTADRQTTIALPDTVAANEKIVVSLGKAPQVEPNDWRSLLHDRLDKAWVDYNSKWDIWKLIEGKVDRKTAASRLVGLGGNPVLHAALMEILLSDDV